MHILRTLIAALFKVVALVVILYSVSLLGLRVCGFDFAVIASNSMQPDISAGDIVILQKTTSSEFNSGEIVQFQSHKSLVLHRIISKIGNSYRTKGDANPGTDPNILKPKQITGVAVGTLRGFGLPLLAIKQLVGIDATNANFTNHISRVVKTSSSVWLDPIAKWKTVSGGGTYTYLSPSSVTSSGNGNRSLYLTKNVSTDKNLYSQLRLTAKDANNATIYLYADMCLPASTPTCGWAIALSESAQTISVQTISSSGNRQAPLYFKTYPLNMLVQSEYVLFTSPTLIQLRIDGNIALSLVNPMQLVNAQGATPPTGNLFGFATINSNQFKSSKTMTW